MSSHARHNEARRYQEAFGGTYAQALRQVREQLPPARDASRALAVPVWDGQAVPPVLLVAQADLARWAIKHLNEVIALGQRLPHNLCEWARLTSYAMTDAHAYTQMMAGTNGAFFQMLGWDDDRIRRHLQCCDADRYVTRDAVAHAAGMFGQPLPPGTDLSSWWTIGGQYAAERS
jgi:hypothetical protein